jgi:hypothetical protein
MRGERGTSVNTKETCGYVLPLPRKKLAAIKSDRQGYFKLEQKKPDAVFRIRIRLIRIRIQPKISIRIRIPDPDPDPGSGSRIPDPGLVKYIEK